MMRKALQNPTVVAIMAILAVIVIIVQISKSVTRWPWQARPIPTTGASTPAKPKGPPPPPQEPVVDTSKILWGAVLDRNPFQPAKTLVAAAGIDPASPNAPDPKPKLSAVWIQDGGRWAIVNKHVVREGDNVQEWTVKSIRPDRIVVNGPRGELTVQFPGLTQEPGQSPPGRPTAPPTEGAPGKQR